jgi:hypothetical protein
VKGHTYLTDVADIDGERRFHGYPDECYSLTTFCDSLIALAYEGVWLMQAPIVDLRNAFVVDFVSDTESHAEASLQHGWNGAWELPMGAASTVYGRRETNEQNALIERHLLFAGTGMTNGDFHRQVVEKLLDLHTCRDAHCVTCQVRFSRGLPEAFQLLADGTEQSRVELFSKWKPSRSLLERLRQDEIEIRWHDLSEIAVADLEANRTYSIWDGSVAQDAAFLADVWAPAWKSQGRASCYQRPS